MKQTECVIFILQALDEARIEYMVGGSVAYMNHAIPRAAGLLQLRCLDTDR